ncbi:MAG TPA: hypothetical protein VFZ21_12860 [Gemmatimonadaceae bacterium]|nr:hypothetical protein [Gemmatimonadaceae bacterium]
MTLCLLTDIVKMSAAAYAMSRPFADQAGSRSTIASLVSRVTSVPSTPTV